MKNTKFKISMGSFCELRRAQTLSECIDKLPKRLANWQSIEFREDDNRIVIDRFILDDDFNGSIRQTIDDWLAFAPPEELKEPILCSHPTQFGKSIEF